MLGEISRKSAFWVLDACKGGNVRRHYQDIEKQLNDMAYCKQQANKNMRKLLHLRSMKWRHINRIRDIRNCLTFR